ncbi:MAG: CBS domain-containing protein [bacterium]
MLRILSLDPVEGIMTHNPVIIPKDKNVEEAAGIMANRKIRCVLIGEKGQIIGILTETDIIRKVVAKELEPSRVKVGEVMSSPPLSVSSKTPIEKVYQTMSDKHIRHLMITDQGKEVGIVSAKDLVCLTAEEMEKYWYNERF